MTDVLLGSKNQNSVWISLDAYNPNGNNQFMAVCSDATFSYNNQYSGSTTGILGQPTSSAIFVDGSKGAIGEINITGVRANPKTSAQTGTPQDNISNARFYSYVKALMEKTQMLQNAYVLRIYNADWTTSQKYENTYVDVPIFISNISADFDQMSPNEMRVSLTAVKRNLGKGFGGA